MIRELADGCLIDVEVSIDQVRQTDPDQGGLD